MDKELSARLVPPSNRNGIRQDLWIRIKKYPVRLQDDWSPHIYHAGLLSRPLPSPHSESGGSFLPRFFFARNYDAATV